MQTRALAPTLISENATLRWVSYALLAIAGSLIMTLSAKVQVPMYPVPMTLQTLAILGIAAAYGRNLAVATMVLYLAQGFFGLPVFAGAATGPAYFAGPTGGFLIGFIVSAAIVGEAADRGWGESFVKIALAMLIGTAAVFTLGFLWLASFAGAATAFTAGVVPFVLGDLVKIAFASCIVAALWSLVRRS